MSIADIAAHQSTPSLTAPAHGPARRPDDTCDARTAAAMTTIMKRARNMPEAEISPAQYGWEGASDDQAHSNQDGKGSG